MKPSLSQRRRRRPLAEINVVPYIDVMLVLLVIFMITAPLLKQGIEVNLPKTQAKHTTPIKEAPIIVSIDRQARYYLNQGKNPQQPLSEAALTQTLQRLLQTTSRAGKTQDVYVKGDRQVGYGAVVKAMSVLQNAGIAHIGLVTQNHTTAHR